MEKTTMKQTFNTEMFKNESILNDTKFNQNDFRFNVPINYYIIDKLQIAIKSLQNNLNNDDTFNKGTTDIHTNIYFNRFINEYLLNYDIKTYYKSDLTPNNIYRYNGIQFVKNMVSLNANILFTFHFEYIQNEWLIQTDIHLCFKNKIDINQLKNQFIVTDEFIGYKDIQQTIINNDIVNYLTNNNQFISINNKNYIKINKEIFKMIDNEIIAINKDELIVNIKEQIYKYSKQLKVNSIIDNDKLNELTKYTQFMQIGLDNQLYLINLKPKQLNYSERNNIDILLIMDLKDNNKITKNGIQIIDRFKSLIDIVKFNQQYNVFNIDLINKTDESNINNILNDTNWKNTKELNNLF